MNFGSNTILKLLLFAFLILQVNEGSAQTLKDHPIFSTIENQASRLRTSFEGMPVRNNAVALISGGSTGSEIVDHYMELANHLAEAIPVSVQGEEHKDIMYLGSGAMPYYPARTYISVDDVHSSAAIVPEALETIRNIEDPSEQWDVWVERHGGNNVQALKSVILGSHYVRVALADRYGIYGDTSEYMAPIETLMETAGYGRDNFNMDPFPRTAFGLDLSGENVENNWGKGYKTIAGDEPCDVGALRRV